MAYVITTKTPMTTDPLAPIGAKQVTCRAVITLDQAQEAAYAIVNDNMAPGEDRVAPQMDAMSLPKSGGTITLPNGTEIEVEFWGAARTVNWMVEHGYDPAVEFFIDTFNTDNHN